MSVRIALTSTGVVTNGSQVTGIIGAQVVPLPRIIIDVLIVTLIHGTLVPEINGRPVTYTVNL